MRNFTKFVLIGIFLLMFSVASFAAKFVYASGQELADSTCMGISDTLTISFLLAYVNNNRMSTKFIKQ